MARTENQQAPSCRCNKGRLASFAQEEPARLAPDQALNFGQVVSFQAPPVSDQETVVVAIWVPAELMSSHVWVAPPED